MVNIGSLLNASERINLEVKRATGGLPTSFWETYSAFANTFGGIIVLGIEEEKDTKRFIPKGLQNPQKMISDLWNMLNNPQKVSENILLDNHIYETSYDGHSFVVVEVPRAGRREKPVYIGSNPFTGTYRRNHEGDYRCKREEVLAMMRDQAEESADNRVIEDMELTDLNPDSISRYRTLFANKKPGHVWTLLNDEEFLIKIGAARRGQDRHIHPTLAGLIFFGDFITITNELPNYFLDYRECLSSETRWSDRVNSGDGKWSGNIFDFYFRIIDRMTADVKTPFQLDRTLLRIDDTPIHAGLRECLANALIHADYYGRCGIVIEKKFREIIIQNPGTFRIDIDAIIAGGISDARNSRIFNMFSLIDVGERSGSGLCNVFHTWAKSGYRKPVIEESLNPDRIRISLDYEIEKNNPGHLPDTLPIDNDENNHDRNESNFDRNENNRDSNRDRNDADDNNICDLTPNEKASLTLLRNNPSATARQIAATCSISVSTVNRTLRTLRLKGYIERIGGTRGSWKILSRENDEK